MLVKSSTELNSPVDNINTILPGPVLRVGVDAVETVLAGHDPQIAYDPPSEVDLAQIFARKRHFATWNMSSVNNASINALFEVGTLAPILKGWGLYRCDFVLTFVYTGTSAVLGMSRAFADPDSYATNYSLNHDVRDPTEETIQISETMPHVDLDMSMPTTQILRLPFNSNYPYYDKTLGTSWRLWSFPLVDKNSVYGMTPPAMDVTIYLHAENVKLERIIPQSKGDPVPKGPLEYGLGIASSIASSSAMPYRSVVQSALSLAEGAARHLGLSRPPNAPNLQEFVLFGGSLAYIDGQYDQSQGIASTPWVSRNVDMAAYPMGDDEEATLASLTSRWGILHTNCPLLTPIRCHPMVSTIPATSTVGRRPTSLSWASMPFTYWRGSLDLEFTFVSSPLIRARYGIVIVPPGIANPGSFPDDGKYLTQIVDVIGTTVSVLNVPYLHSNYLQPTSPMLSLIPSATDGTRVMLFLLAGPYGPSPTPVYPEVLLKIRGGKDYELSVPSLAIPNSFQLVPETIPRTLFVGVEEEIVPQSKVVPGLMGEGFDSVLSLAKRPSIVVDYASLGDAETCWFPADFTPRTMPVMTSTFYKYANLSWSFDTWYRCAFYAYTGGSVWKFFPAVNGRYMVTQYPCGADRDLRRRFDRGSSGAMAVSTDQHPYIEMRSPDRCNTLFKAAGVSLSGAETRTMAVLLDGDLVAADGQAWYAAADDRRYIGFLAPPLLYYDPYIVA